MSNTATEYELFDADEEYLRRPVPRTRCFFCKGITVHNPRCYALQWPFDMRMPFGKHKGKRLGDVPEDYLRWALRRGTCGNSELREAVTLVVKQ